HVVVSIRLSWGRVEFLFRCESSRYRIKMAAPDELFCWEADWGLPSTDTDCLVVLAYAQFAGAPLKLRKMSNPWRSPSGSLPALRTNQRETLSRPSDIIIHLRKQHQETGDTFLQLIILIKLLEAPNLQAEQSLDSSGLMWTHVDSSHPCVQASLRSADNLMCVFQKYNADYDLSAKEGADSLAFISLMEEKLRPALIYSFWVEPKNYVDVTRRWYAEHMPFPLNFFLPGRMQRAQLEKLRLLRGDESLEAGEELEKELYRDATECMNLLSQRLGSNKFFFGDSPSSLDAYVFGHLAPILKSKLPNGKLQQHLKSLDNLNNFCCSILLLYFPRDGRESFFYSVSGSFVGETFSSARCFSESSGQKVSSQPEGGDFDHVPNKRRKQLLSALVALGAMLSYALLTGMVSIQHVQQEALEAPPDLQTIGSEEEEGDG
ncbi:hypothetical protein L3Q82_012868, partial [Scortum barcoo]